MLCYALRQYLDAREKIKTTRVKIFVVHDFVLCALQEVQKDVAQARQYFRDFERQEKKGPFKWLPIKLPGIN